MNVSSVSGASEAVRAATGSRIEVSRSTLSAHVIGVRVAERAHLVLAASTVSAPLGARGPVTLTDGTKFPALPLHWLGAFALGALCAAICLELLHKTRQRRGHPRRANVAAHVTNIA